MELEVEPELKPAVVEKASSATNCGMSGGLGRKERDTTLEGLEI